MSIAQISIGKPYEECCIFYGMKKSGKSNLLAYMLQQLENLRYVLIDVEGVHRWKPKHPEYQLIIKYRRNMEEVLEEVINQIREKKHFVLVVEGIDKFQTTHWMPEWLKDFVNYGRNYEWGRCSYWVTCRRLANVHKDIVGNADHHFLFRGFIPTDVDYYGGFIGKHIAELTKDLPLYHFIYYQVGHEPVYCRPVEKVI